MTEGSKTQVKRLCRAAERDAFIGERRLLQLQMLEHNFNVGVQLFEANKDKLSEEEIEKIEGMMAEQKAALERIRSEANPLPEA